MSSWTDYYSKLLKEDRTEYQDVSYQEKDTDIELRNITVEEVRKSLEKMKNNKAPGPGNIPAELIKNAPIRALEILTNIFNLCLAGDDIPDE